MLTLYRRSQSQDQEENRGEFQQESTQLHPDGNEQGSDQYVRTYAHDAKEQEELEVRLWLLHLLPPELLDPVAKISLTASHHSRKIVSQIGKMNWLQDQILIMKVKRGRSEMIWRNRRKKNM